MAELKKEEQPLLRCEIWKQGEVLAGYVTKVDHEPLRVEFGLVHASCVVLPSPTI